MPLTYASVDTRRPGAAVVGPPATPVFAGASSVAAAHPGSLDVASLRARMRSDTPMPLSDVGQRGLARPMRIDVLRPVDLTLPIASDDVAHPYAPLSVDVDMTRPTYDLSLPTASDVNLRIHCRQVISMLSTLRVRSAHRRLMRLGLLALMFVGLYRLWACAHLSRRCR